MAGDPKEGRDGKIIGGAGKENRGGGGARNGA